MIQYTLWLTILLVHGAACCLMAQDGSLKWKTWELDGGTCSVSMPQGSIVSYDSTDAAVLRMNLCYPLFMLDKLVINTTVVQRCGPGKGIPYTVDSSFASNMLGQNDDLLGYGNYKAGKHTFGRVVFIRRQGQLRFYTWYLHVVNKDWECGYGLILFVPDYLKNREEMLERVARSFRFGKKPVAAR